MPTDPFVILGISKESSQSEILEAYKKKREYYQAHVFDEGDAGAEAARMLEVLDNAYQDAMSYCHEHAVVDGEGNSDFDLVKSAISAKDFVQAQTLLDDMYYRGGEWHYYQAIVFYEKNWLNESKKQLELAVNLDPDNAKYKRALENMKKKIDGTGEFAGGNKGESFQNAQSGGKSQGYNPQQDAATQRTYQQQQANAADGCCTACQCAICADCCCECMGGDLIRCC